MLLGKRKWKQKQNLAKSSYQTITGLALNLTLSTEMYPLYQLDLRMYSILIMQSGQASSNESYQQIHKRHATTGFQEHSREQHALKPPVCKAFCPDLRKQVYAFLWQMIMKFPRMNYRTALQWLLSIQVSSLGMTGYCTALFNYPCKESHSRSNPFTLRKKIKSHFCIFNFHWFLNISKEELKIEDTCRI